MTLQPYRLQYRFHGEPQEHVLELERRPDARESALHLLELHFADAENSLVLPSEDDDTEAVMRQAELLGITHIQLR
ncbi:hypothetical protein [Pseudomonas sp. ML96]|uniref:hypothetical protein n=1 Tax=Pseudomonas sp. ML96 TaxID=1523503 RepID=UPI0005BB3247|nr:hypothetical protein [Pseudomonas sp. ML96]